MDTGARLSGVVAWDLARLAALRNISWSMWPDAPELLRSDRCSSEVEETALLFES